MVYRLILCLIFISGGALSLAAACEDRPANALELVVEGFGTLYFAEADTRVQLGEIDLGGGVCIDLGGGAELRAAELTVRSFPMNPVFLAHEVRLLWAGWTFTAATLAATEAEVVLSDLTFTGELSGRAGEAALNLETLELTMLEITAVGQGFQIGAERAVLNATTLVFEEVVVTTCLCRGDRKLYVVRGKSAVYDLREARVVMREGVLEVGSLTLALDDFELSEAALADLRFPLVIEYVTANGETGAPGTGLGVRIPSIPLDEATTLELGVTGLDIDFPLNGIMLFRHRSSSVDFEIGKSAAGPQLDFTLRHPLTAWLNAALSTTNRHWQGQDFLHEVKLSLLAAHQVEPLAGHRLTADGELFAAGSRQTIEQQPVQGTRLGGRAELLYQSPQIGAGRFSVRLRSQLTSYPYQQVSQWGLYLEPRYQGRIGPVNIDANLRRQWSNSASPFSTRLDRLEPLGDIGLTAQWAPVFSAEVRATFRVSARYDFLKGDPRLTQNISQLSLLANLTWEHSELTVNPFVMTDLAPYFNDALAARRRPFIEGGLNLKAERWEAGFVARVNPRAQFGLEKVEFSASFPVTLSSVTLQPYIALDILPTLLDNDLPRVSGHGLEITWASCCGTFVIGYRQQENTFSTSLGFRLGD